MYLLLALGVAAEDWNMTNGIAHNSTISRSLWQKDAPNNIGKNYTLCARFAQFKHQKPNYLLDDGGCKHDWGYVCEKSGEMNTVKDILLK